MKAKRKEYNETRKLKQLAKRMQAEIKDCSAAATEAVQTADRAAVPAASAVSGTLINRVQIMEVAARVSKLEGHVDRTCSSTEVASDTC